MKVVLLQNIKSLGAKGEVKNVSDGYARNFLFPQNLALVASDKILAKLQSKAGQDSAKARKEIKSHDQLIEKLDQKEVIIRARASKKGTLFKAVSEKDISLEIKRQLGYNVDEKYIQLEQPIKIAGEFRIKIKLNEKAGELLIRVKELDGQKTN
ncbi:MAG TPA: 50S ribosomal protein L9 [Patescibacteria group bacterium]|nr:50S ribosomal protein L9 [Patescibacteria group bacterium]